MNFLDDWDYRAFFAIWRKHRISTLIPKLLKRKLIFFAPTPLLRRFQKYTLPPHFFFIFDLTKKIIQSTLLMSLMMHGWFFFFSDKNLSKKSFFIEHVFYFLIRLCTVGLWIWISRSWNSLFKIQKGGNFKMLFCCFVHNIYAVFYPFEPTVCTPYLHILHIGGATLIHCYNLQW